MTVAWSYSVLDSFETCPRRHYLIKVAKKVTEQQNEQMLHGNRVHRALEHRLKERLPLDRHMEHYEPFAQRVERSAVGGRLLTEQKLAINENFQACTYFAKDVWVRVITDFTILKGRHGFIGDWKTGNPNPESAQLRLSAAVTFAHNREIETITNSFIWLKTGTVTKETFKRSDVAEIWQGFMPRIRRLEIAFEKNEWPARPSGLCKKHCPVGKANCEHCGS